MIKKNEIMGPVSVGLALLLALGTNLVRAEENVEFHGAGWLQMGRVEKSFTSSKHTDNDYNKNWMQNAGGVFNVAVKDDGNWDAAFGMGVVQVHLARGNRSNTQIWYPFWVPFLTEAKVTYKSSLFTADDKLSITLGEFQFKYNSDIKDLGLYLLKGYVYPGAIQSVSGNMEGMLSTDGILVDYQKGSFKNDLILKLETDDKPLYDLSIADIVKYQVSSGFELGFGVNFYRAFAQNKKLTSPSKTCSESNDLGPYANQGQKNACFIVDTTGTVPDTITGSLAGTKLMGMFRFDPKTFLTSSIFGKNDLVLYGEAALIGVKDYKVVYAKKSERIPVMIGFNFPTFGFLEYLSGEFEYYGSKNFNDNLVAQNGSWVPGYDPEFNPTRDNIKYSVSMAKVLGGHIFLWGQVANDHLRLGGTHNVAAGHEVTSTLVDWYWSTKIAYFF